MLVNCMCSKKNMIVIVLSILLSSCRSNNPIGNNDNGNHYLIAFDDGHKICTMLDTGSDVKNLVLPDSSMLSFHLYPRWSPDSQYIAMYRYTINGFQLLTYNLKTKELRNLVQINTTGSIILSLAWSPDSRWITYFGSHLELEMISVDGKSEATIDDNIAVEIPQWAPDAGSIVFTVMDRNTKEWFTYIYYVATRTRKRITVPFTNVHCGGWSGDGERILLYGPISTQSSVSKAWNVYEYDVSRGKSKQLTFNNCSIPWSYSPDGNSVLLTLESPVDPSSVENLAVLDLRTLDIHQITNINDRTLSILGSPLWSPDGGEICFNIESTTGAEKDVYCVNSDGAGLRLLRQNATNACWSPK